MILFLIGWGAVGLVHNLGPAIMVAPVGVAVSVIAWAAIGSIVWHALRFMLGVVLPPSTQLLAIGWGAFVAAYFAASANGAFSDLLPGLRRGSLPPRSSRKS